MHRELRPFMWNKHLQCELCGHVSPVAQTVSLRPFHSPNYSIAPTLLVFNLPALVLASSNLQTFKLTTNQQSQPIIKPQIISKRVASDYNSGGEEGLAPAPRASHP